LRIELSETDTQLELEDSKYPLGVTITVHGFDTSEIRLTDRDALALAALLVTFVERHRS
jgi:hypothetical protein